MSSEAKEQFAVRDTEVTRLHAPTGDDLQTASAVCTDTLAVEAPLEVRLAWNADGVPHERAISVTMRTPGNDAELAAGFLVTEGVVRDAAEIAGVQQISPGVVQVALCAGVDVRLGTLERNFYTTSSCGICGKASLAALRTVMPPRRTNGFRTHADVLWQLPERLRAAQGIFSRTGGLHGAGLFTAAGELVAIREDVGRHNAVDKLLGAELLADRTPLLDRLLLLSGRASFELLQKAVMAGVPMVAAVGAPSSLAVDVARDFDVTLVGFLRGQGCNVYHGRERVLV